MRELIREGEKLFFIQLFGMGRNGKKPKNNELAGLTGSGGLSGTRSFSLNLAMSEKYRSQANKSLGKALERRNYNSVVQY